MTETLQAVGLLMLAIALFALSTRQSRVWVRAIAWSLGAAALGAAAWFSTTAPTSFGVIRAVVLGLTQPDSHGDALKAALSRDLSNATQHLPPLLDFAVIVAAILGGLCLLAFTRGDALERMLRPLLAGLVGLVIGALLTVAVFAAGLGGEAPRAVLMGTASAQDGDTLSFGETAVRIWGLDAPELGQTCLGDTRADCGEAARQYLAGLVGGKVVFCYARFSTRTSKRTESFGRPLTQCFVEDQDVAASVISAGHGIQYKDRDDYNYRELQDAAKSARRGFWAGCALRPDVWRNEPFVVEGFLRKSRVDLSDIAAENTDTIYLGECRMLSAAPLGIPPSTPPTPSP